MRLFSARLLLTLGGVWGLACSQQPAKLAPERTHPDDKKPPRSTTSQEAAPAPDARSPSPLTAALPMTKHHVDSPEPRLTIANHARVKQYLFIDFKPVTTLAPHSEAIVPLSPGAHTITSSDSKDPDVGSVSVSEVFEPHFHYRYDLLTRQQSGTTHTAELRVTTDEFPDISLKNLTNKSYRMLVNPLLQPARLRLFDATGEELAPRDRREVMKFDNTVRSRMFVALAPGESISLGSVTLRVHEGSRSISYGPYRYEGVRTGQHQAVIEWESRASTALDENGELERVENVWLGTVHSQRFKFDMP